MVSVKKVSMFIIAAIMGNVLCAQNSEPISGQTPKSEKGAKSGTEKKAQKAIEEKMEDLHSNGEKRPKKAGKLEAIMEQTMEKENGVESEAAQPFIDENSASKVEKQKLEAIERKQEEKAAAPVAKPQVTRNEVEKINKTPKSTKTKLKSGAKKKKGKVKKAIKAAKRK